MLKHLAIVGILGSLVVASLTTLFAQTKPVNQPGQVIAKPSDGAHASAMPAAVPTSNSDEDLQIQMRIANFTAGLVVVGLIQAIALFLTIIWIRRQARFMGQHAVSLEELADAARSNSESAKATLASIQRQAELLQMQIEKMERSVSASEKSAEAARDNVELLIRKERAHIIVDVGKFNPENLQPINYTVICYGPSPALDCHGHATGRVSESKDAIDDFSSFMPMMGIPEIMREGSIEAAAMLSNANGLRLDANQLQKLNKGELFIHFRGDVEYRDIFQEKYKNSHRCSFYYVYGTTDFKNLDGAPFCLWQKVFSDPEFNRET